MDEKKSPIIHIKKARSLEKGLELFAKRLENFIENYENQEEKIEEFINYYNSLETFDLFVIGGAATLQYYSNRDSTKDFDILTNCSILIPTLKKSNIEGIKPGKESFFLFRKKDWVGTYTLPLEDIPDLYYVLDLIFEKTPSSFYLTEEIIERSKNKLIFKRGKFQFFLFSPEDLFLTKIFSYTEARERDNTDIHIIVNNKKDFDWEYVIKQFKTQFEINEQENEDNFTLPYKKYDTMVKCTQNFLDFLVDYNEKYKEFANEEYKNNYEEYHKLIISLNTKALKNFTNYYWNHFLIDKKHINKLMLRVITRLYNNLIKNCETLNFPLDEIYGEEIQESTNKINKMLYKPLN